MDRFERELGLFGRLPYEDALRRGELAAPTGARGQELAAIIDGFQRQDAADQVARTRGA